ncbi:hypothetical protein [Cytobacillus gottheilii]|uniref:hypothetical protein n=1 Tax=Cytobacillus gottheilii TaxID=859144 RepID=UPI00159480AF|nr:hypothetical protein [Cytobacillus gottheilii]
MSPIDALLNLILFVIIIYLISRAAHHFTHTKRKLHELEQKLDDVLKRLDGKDL